MDRKVSRRGLLKETAVLGGGLLLGRRFRDLIAGSGSQLGNELPHKFFLPLVYKDYVYRSAVYRVTGFPKPTWGTEYHEGVDALLELRGGEGLKFYRTAEESPLGGPRGLIASDDVVLIKINSQWPERGMTNTDVLRGLISRIVTHPDGFTGEVVVVENTQSAEPHFDDVSGNNDDFPDHSQSARDVADRFASQGVSLYSWTDIKDIEVNEYDEGDDDDGYVLAGGYPFNYPKFKTARDTKVSLRYGIWDGGGYDASRLKFLNVPVLKFHYTLGLGLTAAVKHFVGFLSRFVGEEEAGGDTFAFHHNLYEDWNGQPRGILGRLLALRFPDLNIVDATYVGIYNHMDCPIDDPAKTVAVRSLLASHDPVAVDYYCSKHILWPLKLGAGHEDAEEANPDADNLLRAYLLASRERLLEAGRPANFGDEQIRLVEYTFPG